MSFLLTACVVAENPYAGLPPGLWRGVLLLESRPVMPNPRGEPLPEKTNLQFEEVTEGELPFVFEVKYANPDSFYLEIINGTERVIVNDIHLGRDRSTGRDTFLFRFPVYQSYLRGAFSENVLEGEWVVESKENYRIPFQARHGRDYRFTTLKKMPVMDISGKWEATFETETDHPYKAVGEFQQKGNYLTGTFLTESGDYRYLEGTVQANKVYLSAFDGAHAFLFEAKIQPDSTLIGSFKSGKDYKTVWEARRNPKFQLRDPHELTFLKPGYGQLEFSFPDETGKMVSLADPAYQGKVKVIQIMGTWCPNCRDETAFLVDYLKNNPNDELKVIALAFERKQDIEKIRQNIRHYKSKTGVTYDMLLAGNDNKVKASEALPMLNGVLAYPTLLLVDRNNQVRRIHTGFTGPATSQYKSFENDFKQSVLKLLGEKNVQ